MNLLKEHIIGALFFFFTGAYLILNGVNLTPETDITGGGGEEIGGADKVGEGDYQRGVMFDLYQGSAAGAARRKVMGKFDFELTMPMMMLVNFD